MATKVKFLKSWELKSVFCTSKNQTVFRDRHELREKKRNPALFDLSQNGLLFSGKWRKTDRHAFVFRNLKVHSHFKVFCIFKNNVYVAIRNFPTALYESIWSIIKASMHGNEEVLYLLVVMRLLLDFNVVFLRKGSFKAWVLNFYMKRREISDGNRNIIFEHTEHFEMWMHLQKFWRQKHVCLFFAISWKK